MKFLLMFGLNAAIIFVLIAVHEVGHYLAGLTAGIPARSMRVVLLAFPQHVVLRDGDAWVSPVKDIARYIAVARSYIATRAGAFRYVAGGIVVETIFAAGVSLAALHAGWSVVAFWTAAMSLALYAINVLLMDLPWALLHRHSVGDTSGLWEIARLPAVVFTVAVIAVKVLLVVYVSREIQG